MYYFSLRIIDSKDDTINTINDIIGIESNEEHLAWGYGIYSEYRIDFVSQFLSILEGKYDALANIGVMRNNISIWMLYEYEDQCNMEFTPQETKTLGEAGITLCVSCWDK